MSSLCFDVDDQGDELARFRNTRMKEDVKTNPAFRDADIFRSGTEKLFWGARGVSNRIGHIPVNRNLTDLRCAFNIFFSNIGNCRFFEFRHGSFEEACHDSSLCKQAFGMLIIRRISIIRRMIFRRKVFFLLHDAMSPSLPLLYHRNSILSSVGKVWRIVLRKCEKARHPHFDKYWGNGGLCVEVSLFPTAFAANRESRRRAR